MASLAATAALVRLPPFPPKTYHWDIYVFLQRPSLIWMAKRVRYDSLTTSFVIRKTNIVILLVNQLKETPKEGHVR